MAQVPQPNPAPDATPFDQAARPPAAGPSNTARVGRAVREIVETLLLAAVIFVAVRLVVLNFKVDGASMQPNLHNEEMLLVNNNAYRSFDLPWVEDAAAGDAAQDGGDFYLFSPPERGDIIVFDPPSKNERERDKPYIKRIIGLPGEHVQVADAGGVFVNGVRLDEPYIDQETTCDGPRRHCDLVVPPGNVYVLGDNRNNSTDSRVFGPVPIERVIGKAWLAYWPPADAGLVPHHDYPGIPEVPAAGAAAATPLAEAERQQERAERRRDRAARTAATPVP
jgi:signal peptidase I